MRACRLSLYFAGAAIALPCWVLAAPPAPAVSGPTLKHAVESAWARSSTVRTIDARQEETAAARANARSWLAENPVIGLSQRKDQGNTERNQRESELSVSSSIWLPGQKAARETLAARSTDEVSAHLALTRLAVAGEVRNRLWEAAAAQATLAERQAYLKDLEQLAAEVQQRVKAGDLARSDGLLARQEVLAARVELSDATTAVAQTLARYRALTGHASLPPLDPEPLAEGQQGSNPRLAAMRATEQRAQAALRVASATRATPPTIALSVRREDEQGLREPNRSIGVELQVPIGSKGRNRTVEAQAQTAIVTAAAEAAEAQAEVEADLSIARERLANARAALEAAEERAAAMHEHTVLLEKAFRLGERGLADVLRSRALKHEADIAAGQQRIALGLAHAQFNQALGIIP